MSKATHTGTCQICGNTQKLPKGRLSKHGYTVDFGFFSGTCSGAGHLPFEQSCDLIQDAITRVEAALVQLNEQHQKLLTDSSEVWVSVRNQITRKRVETCFKQSEIICNKETINGTNYVRLFVDGVKHQIGFCQNTPEEIHKEIVKLNKTQAWRVENQIKQAEQYIAWQKDRVANWQPSELTPIEAA